MTDTPSPSPIAYQEFPKWLEHPSNDRTLNNFPPVIVLNSDQESYHRSLGYESPGQPDPFAFLTAKATEKMDGVLSQIVKSSREEIENLRKNLSNYISSNINSSIKTSVENPISHLEKRFSNFERRLSNLEALFVIEENSPKLEEMISEKDGREFHLPRRWWRWRQK